MSDPITDDGDSVPLPPKAQSWELEPKGHNSDNIECYHFLTTYRRLCRQPCGWVLHQRTVIPSANVEQGRHGH
jgi:hypothetical protein